MFALDEFGSPVSGATVRAALGDDPNVFAEAKTGADGSATFQNLPNRTILLTGVWQSGQTSTAAVAAGFNTAMPEVGGWIVAFSTFLFGYTTLIGWAYYGEQFFEYILGRSVTIPYRWIYCLLIPFGAISKVDVVYGCPPTQVL